ncbi:MAG: pilus assembly PilX N-terminal domain-containing protein [Planctomycetes bacterium]|nr:pilus assembly PilX N-terminal domain-containing protein [Planctomycetota bacterium]
MRILRARRRTGAVLVVMLGVLFILSLLAVTFAQVSALDRSVASSYLDEVRARLVARGGIEWALAQVSASADRGVFFEPAMQYWGSNASESGSPDWSTPLELALNPSFAWENESPQNPGDADVSPLPFSIDGRSIGISRPMAGGTYAHNADVFRLRLIDANSLIHLNDGLEHGPTGNVSRNLRRILNVLGSIVGIRSTDAGDRIIAARPSTGYRSKTELLPVLGPDDYQRIRPFVAATAWTDPDAVNPVPLSQETLSAYPVPYNEQIGLYRYGRSSSSSGAAIKSSPLRWAPEFAGPTGTAHAVMALDELNAQWIERARRAPVNINLAPKPILAALISGLRGWFMVERRKSNPGQGMYTFLFHTRYDNTPAGKRGDEIGYLYSTREFLAPGSTGDGIPAEHVADEIVACRHRRPSPHLPGLHYANVWYGGPFRAWRQFNAFCDGLAAGGLLVDNRPIFYDFTAAGSSDWWGDSSNGGAGPDTLIDSEIQRRFAAQAMADVLKANFNPNCTLNELNPDANLYTIVDKTDLIVNSTEFCFTPMGVFEIESEGLILRTPNAQDLLVLRAAEIVARKKIVCVAKAYDVVRETTQADFYQGERQARPPGSPMTDTNTGLELGPEPDSGPAPGQCRWSGWIQLATIGGPWKNASQKHVPLAVESTPIGSSAGCGLMAGMHAHFGLDHRLHHHADGKRDPISVSPLCRNNPDRTETAAGPYGPTVGAPGTYRLARDWSLSSLPAAPHFRAASDLRVDGAYVERDSALMYLPSTGVLGSAGTVALWIKPSYFPEMAGKPRTYFSVDTLKNETSQVWQIINGLWFFASADAPAFAPSPNEGRLPIYASGPWRPASIVGGYSTWSDWGGGVGQETDTLNHAGHAHRSRPSLLRHHAWTHVTYMWDMPRQRAVVWINGEPQANTESIFVHPGPIGADDYLTPGNLIRLGEPSLTMQTSQFWFFNNQAISRNWAADATIDEFFLWKGNQLDRSQELFAQGRYHCPMAVPAVFTSRRITFPTSRRELPPPSTAALPSGMSGTPPTGTSLSSPQIRILAAAWTWYPESVSWTGQPQIHDFFSDKELLASVEMRFVRNNFELPAILSDDGGSAVPDLILDPSDSFAYRLSVRLRNASPQTILLAGPVIDDVTIYASSSLEYLAYELVETSL